MQYLGKPGGNILSIMWFGTLFLLGVDSMFAMVEGVATVITDTPRFRHLRKESVALWTCMLGFLCSIVFVSDIGFALLDVFDHYILTFGLMLTGAVESFVVTWVWGWPEIRYRCGWMCALSACMLLSQQVSPVDTPIHQQDLGNSVWLAWDLVAPECVF
jgi:SNF family Na+-dependent transporter